MMVAKIFPILPLFAASFAAEIPAFAADPATATLPDEAAPADAPAIVAPAATDARYTTTQEMKIETRLTAFFLERAHILEKKIAETDMTALIETDCSALDSTRSIFLQSDVDALKTRFAPTLADYLARGNLHAGFTIYKLFLLRLDERLAKIDERLQKPETFNLDRDDELKLNRKEKIWPADKAAADALWEQRLTNELITELLSGNDDDDSAAETTEKSETAKSKDSAAGTADADVAAKSKALAEPTPENIAAACKKMRERYAKLRTNLTLEPWEVEEIFLNALTSQYDPHTSFFSKQSMEEFEIMMRNSLCGIGAVLTMSDGYCTIREIMPGSPVERSGKISVGDRIIAVGTTEKNELVDVVGIRLNRIVRMLRGEKGVPVRLLVESGNDRSRRFVTLIRDEIKLTEQLASAEIFIVPTENETVPVGVITLPSFYGKDRAAESAFSTAEDVKELIRKLKFANIRALVLDLRRNGGGYLNEAIDLLELFVGPDVPALQTKGMSGRAETLVTGGSILGPAKSLFSSEPEWSGPMLVLVSKLSASASEIVAGALQDNRRAIIVGDPHTHGKGSVQEVIPFKVYDSSLNASIKLTRSKWYAPSGNSIQIRGVSADIVTPSVYSVLPVGEGDLERPLPWDSVPSVLDDPAKTPTWMSAPISPELIKILDENSRRRQAELPEFLTHHRTVAWFKEKEEKKSVPLSLKKRLAMRESDRAFSDFVKAEYTTLEAETGYEKHEVKLDSAVEQQKESDANAAKKSSLLSGGNSALPGMISSSDDEKDWPDYDVLLRESVRIAADWVELVDAQKKSTESTDVPAEKAVGETAEEAVPAK